MHLILRSAAVCLAASIAAADRLPSNEFLFTPNADGAAAPRSVAVAPAAETTPVDTTDDSADDACIWVHPQDPEKSLIIGTNKEAGLEVYDLNGRLLQSLGTLRPNNVDLRAGFSLEGGAAVIVAASNRADDTIGLYSIDIETRKLHDVSARVIEAGMEVYGLGMYRSSLTGDYYVFVNSKAGEVKQWRLAPEGQKVGAELVRSFHVGSQLEGVAADDELGHLYIGEENVAIWRYGAEPDFEAEERELVDLTLPRGNFTADVEGLALYTAPDGGGYLLASSQGDHRFLVYERRPPNRYIGSFRIESEAGIDRVTGTDGIAATSAPVGSRFPQGLFVAQDDEDDAGTQNFKLVSWSAIADALDLPR
jgi:3-phytase